MDGQGPPNFVPRIPAVPRWLQQLWLGGQNGEHPLQGQTPPPMPPYAQHPPAMRPQPLMPQQMMPAQQMAMQQMHPQQPRGQGAHRPPPMMAPGQMPIGVQMLPHQPPPMGHYMHNPMVPPPPLAQATIVRGRMGELHPAPPACAPPHGMHPHLSAACGLLPPPPRQPQPQPQQPQQQPQQAYSPPDLHGPPMCAAPGAGQVSPAARASPVAEQPLADAHSPAHSRVTGASCGPTPRSAGTKRPCEQTDESTHETLPCTRSANCRKAEGHAGRCGPTYPSGEERVWLEAQLHALDQELHDLTEERDKLRDEATTIWAVLSKACVLLCSALKDGLPTFASLLSSAPSSAARLPLPQPAHSAADRAPAEPERGAAEGRGARPPAEPAACAPRSASSGGSAQAPAQLEEGAWMDTVEASIAAGAEDPADEHAPAGAASCAPTHAASSPQAPAVVRLASAGSSAAAQRAPSSSSCRRDGPALDRPTIVRLLSSLARADADAVREHGGAQRAPAAEPTSAPSAGAGTPATELDEIGRRHSELAECVLRLSQADVRSRSRSCGSGADPLRGEDFERDADAIVPHMLLAQAMGMAAATEVLMRRADLP